MALHFDKNELATRLAMQILRWPWERDIDRRCAEWRDGRDELAKVKTSGAVGPMFGEG